MPWYVLITKPKAELKVKERLEKIGIEVCCPVRIESRKWSDRIKKITVPLLPSMVLVNLLEKERNLVFGVAGVVRYLFYLQKPAVVKEKEIEILQDLNNKKDDIISIASIKPGDKIELSDFGSFKGKGLVKQVSKNQCWVILEQLGYVVTLKL